MTPEEKIEALEKSKAELAEQKAALAQKVKAEQEERQKAEQDFQNKIKELQEAGNKSAKELSRLKGVAGKQETSATELADQLKAAQEAREKAEAEAVAARTELTTTKRLQVVTHALGNPDPRLAALALDEIQAMDEAKDLDWSDDEKTGAVVDKWREREANKRLLGTSRTGNTPFGGRARKEQPPEPYSLVGAVANARRMTANRKD